MLLDIPAFNFEHIPLNIDRSSIRVFQHSKEAFSLEYAIFNPKTVRINMCSITRSRFGNRGTERGLATIQQFATAMGLHPDFHKICSTPIDLVIEMLSPIFQIGSDGPKFYCGGILILDKNVDPPITAVDGFSDEILEILTEEPQFAFLQYVFRSIKLPKSYQIDEEEEIRGRAHLSFDVQQGRVERRIRPSITNIMEEIGCYEFSPRIIVVETSRERLSSKLNRLSVLFASKGFKIRSYPTFWRRLTALKKLCIKRKVVSPVIVDGYSLMNFLSLPQRQFSHQGYSLVPNKKDYQLSSGGNMKLSRDAINLGVPIISGKTTDVPLLVEGKELSRHIAVFGMTGEGKSRFIYGLIKEFFQKKVKFLIFDPKGEYLQPIQSFCLDVIYLKPGSKAFPWGINIFQIPKNDAEDYIVPLEDHIQFVVSVFEHVFEDADNISPQMRRFLHQAVIHTIQEQGDLRDFLSFLQKPDKLGMKGAYLEKTAAGVINRIEKLFFGNLGRCFSVKQTSFEISSLLDHNAIIDLSSFEAMENQTGLRIFMDVVLQCLYYFVRSDRAPFKEESLPKNVMIIDEIQKFIPIRNFRMKTPESMIGRGPWTLRAYDISMIFIGTDPIVEQPILTNVGVFAVFFTKFDPYVMSNFLGVSKQEYEQLRSLLKIKNNERRCIVSINGRISLMKTNEFVIGSESFIDLTKLQALPIQKHLRETYENSIFDPIKELQSHGKG
ncbi:MAG: ATP-binding protein [Candidatus Hodarchaeales archaeon]|jgi:hypothetical protein